MYSRVTTRSKSKKMLKYTEAGNSVPVHDIFLSLCFLPVLVFHFPVFLMLVLAQHSLLKKFWFSCYKFSRQGSCSPSCFQFINKQFSNDCAICRVGHRV